MPTLDPRTTALVLIDLQHGIVGMDLAPRSGAAVVETAQVLATRFRETGALIVTVHVGWAQDGSDRPSQAVDQSMPAPPGGLPAEWSDFVDGIHQPGDIAILKHHWGAFTGTELDLQLRRRGIGTIVLAGIATNFGVESTARSGWELGYDLIIVEDACTSRDTALHAFAIERIFPQIARVVTSDAITLGDETHGEMVS